MKAQILAGRPGGRQPLAFTEARCRASGPVDRVVGADAGGPSDTHTSRIPAYPARATTEDQRMSKGMDRKKEDKKKPAKTMKEKKAEKKEKKAGKGFAPV